ncbi:MAG: hypothetical protein IPJ38_19725 [Dechloromonas sp.]|uniref:SbsA Ig-like domain-containing protein n=1 Tax=Candidatus Dechloromonas phosphorivorans TaxID=2899244 RepID=A0A935K2E1_9RHOO|nr:hypothetical protein [Candidatus Dechloromonas phosphorivorans]
MANSLHPLLIACPMNTFRFLMLATALLAPLAVQSASVRQFLPQGQVADNNRVTVRFNSDMVHLGDTDAAAPFSIDCQGIIAGEARWTDNRTWAWQMAAHCSPASAAFYAKFRVDRS